MESTISDARFNIILMLSLPESYRPTLQTITAAKRTSRLAGGQMLGMKHDDLISFILEEAQHRVINDERTKSAETALAAHTKKGKQNKSGKQKKSGAPSKTTTEECDNCGRPGHTTTDCFSKGGGKEAEAPWKKKEKKPELVMLAVANEEDNDFLHSLAPLITPTWLNLLNSQNPNLGHVLIAEQVMIILPIGPNSPIIKWLIGI